MKYFFGILLFYKGREKFCYIGRECYEYDEICGIDFFEKVGLVENGCVFFERDLESKKLKVVGIINNCFNSG